MKVFHMIDLIASKSRDKWLLLEYRHWSRESYENGNSLDAGEWKTLLTMSSIYIQLYEIEGQHIYSSLCKKDTKNLSFFKAKKC